MAQAAKADSIFSARNAAQKLTAPHQNRLKQYRFRILVSTVTLTGLAAAASYITGTEIVIDGGLGSSNRPNIPGIFAGR